MRQTEVRFAELVEALRHLHEYGRDPKDGTLSAEVMVQTCPRNECVYCGIICCPHQEMMHFHHDGCPACIEDEADQ